MGRRTPRCDGDGCRCPPAYSKGDGTETPRDGSRSGVCTVILGILLTHTSRTIHDVTRPVHTEELKLGVSLGL